MIIGLAGAHRCGKSTLARILSDELNIKLFETNTADVAKAMGVNAVGSLTLSERLNFQQKLLAHHISALKSRDICITDRTPLDMASYMLCEIGMNHLNERENDELDARIVDYLELCVEATAKYYTGVLCLCPLDTYEVLPGKPTNSAAYQAHVQMCIKGLLMEVMGRTNVIICMDTALTKRVECGIDFVNAIIKSTSIIPPGVVIH